MLRRFISLGRNQRGFTLIEVLVANAITGFIGVGIAAVVFQIINVSALSNNHVIIVKQVESAIHWINHDAQMAQTVQPSVGSGFPLNLSWVEWDNTSHQVSYVLQNGELIRNHAVNGGEAQETMVAQYINTESANTTCQFVGGVLTLRVTASVGGFKSASETRISQVIPRSAP